MKTYTIHLIRHALTKGNLEGRYIGQTDEELCKEGIAQLEKMKSDYDYPYPEVVFTSTLKRCIETARILYPDKTPIEMRGFEECDFGEFEGHTADELERYVDIMAALGAKTATSLEEIATSMQKVAATGNTVGVSMEQVSSIIATVSSVTRESAESIGTSFKTIFAFPGSI